MSNKMLYKLSIPFIIVAISNSYCVKDSFSSIKKYYERYEKRFDSKLPVVEDFEESYDFIIIGSGSGGSVMANRLSEICDWKILLLEAGEQGNFLTDIPLIANKFVGSNYDWKYKTERQPDVCLITDGYCDMPCGKALGGTSAINGMVYNRGNKENYNDWSRLGNTEWNYEEALRYFKKSEGVHIERWEDSFYHSTGGELTVEHSGYETPLLKSFLEAGEELGYDEIDYNGETQTGFAKFQLTLRNGRRCSASKAFLKPASSRRNLFISTSSFVTKILISSRFKVAMGVEFKKNGKTYSVYARKEVILSAGTINSPQILMLSGIGPSEHLRQMDILVIHDSNVGYNFRDQVGIASLLFYINDDISIKDSVLQSKSAINNYFEYGLGPLTAPYGIEGIAFMNTKFSKDSSVPDIEVTISSSQQQFPQLANTVNISVDYNSFGMNTILLNALSIGRITLKSKDPEEPPKIVANYFTDQRDMDALIDGVKLTLKLAETSAFKKYNTTLNPSPIKGCEHLDFESDAYWECYIRQSAIGYQHKVGTCKMGPCTDPTAVVDEYLKVRGILGLRVVDASVMPTLPACHTNAVVYMIAEKAADMVKEAWLN